MKTLLLYSEKRARSFRAPKQVGTATANHAALTIYDFRKLVSKPYDGFSGGGKFYIVDAENVDAARAIIKAYHLTPTAFLEATEHDNGHTVCIGKTAMQAIFGAEKSIANWDRNIEKYGSVPISKTRAL